MLTSVFLQLKSEAFPHKFKSFSFNFRSSIKFVKMSIILYTNQCFCIPSAKTFLKCLLFFQLIYKYKQIKIAHNSQTSSQVIEVDCQVLILCIWDLNATQVWTSSSSPHIHSKRLNTILFQFRHGPPYFLEFKSQCLVCLRMWLLFGTHQACDASSKTR